MFDCRACAAKDAEIARLVAQLAEKDDRFMALIGERFQSQLMMGATVGPPPEVEDQHEPLSDAEYAERELDAAALEAQRNGTIQPDFPS